MDFGRKPKQLSVVNTNLIAFFFFFTSWRASCQNSITEDIAAHSKESPQYDMLFKVGIFVLLLFWRKGIRIISFPAAALETHSVLVVHSLHVSVRSATDICMYIAYTYPIYK